jgi:hypothetical protein
VTIRSVETPHYHIWTDALHGRHLARETANDWDRGTYVRWTIASAWTAFESVCEHLTGDTSLGIRFKERLNEALRDRGFSPPDWGSGLWQDVLRIYRLRKEYIHPNVAQERLFAPVEEAEKAIATLRFAIKDMYSRTGTPQEAWPDDDQNPIDPRKGFVAHLTVVGHGTVVEGGARREDALRICYVMNGQEYEERLMQPGKDYRLYVDELLRKIVVPISAVRVYRGNEQVEEIVIKMRGS